MYRYEHNYGRPPHRRRYDEAYDRGYRGFGYGPRAVGYHPTGNRPAGPGRGSNRFPRDMWHDTSEFDRAFRGEGGPWKPARGLSRYDRGYSRAYAQRFRRPPEGAELREFRPEEMGHLRDR